MIIVSPQYGVIPLNKINADDIPAPNLAGSETFYCSESFGAITLQEYKNDFFTFRFAVFNLIKKVTFFIQEETLFLKSTFSLNNDFKIKARESRLKLKKGHYIFYSAEKEEALLEFEKPENFHVFESSFSEKLLLSFFDAFPSLKQYTDNFYTSGTGNKIKATHLISLETKKIINDILSCPYDQNLRKLYFENKVNDLLFEILLQTLKGGDQINTLTEKETNAIFKTREIILEDVTKHYSVKDLSRMVELGQLKLKTGFKQTFGIGTFEYLLQSRMEKAYHLITQTDKPIKEIASEIGFNYVANFITSFGRHFGKTPGELRKK